MKITIRESDRKLLGFKKVVEIEGVAGPSYVGCDRRYYKEPVTLESAIWWIEKHWEVVRAGRIIFSDGTFIVFHQSWHFARYEDTPDKNET